MTREDIFHWVKEEYGTEPEYQWISFPQYAVLRNKTGKWYGIVMDVPKNKFGIGSDDVIDVLNVKADKMLIDLLIHEPGFYRAYHMNKTQWVSIFLDGTVSDETIRDFLAESYKRTSKQCKTK